MCSKRAHGQQLRSQRRDGVSTRLEQDGRRACGVDRERSEINIFDDRKVHRKFQNISRERLRKRSQPIKINAKSLDDSNTDGAAYRCGIFPSQFFFLFWLCTVVVLCKRRRRTWVNSVAVCVRQLRIQINDVKKSRRDDANHGRVLTTSRAWPRRTNVKQFYRYTLYFVAYRQLKSRLALEYN